MGVRNYLIEGVSGAGKTTVAEELARRGHHVIHGDRKFAYYGDPATGAPIQVPEVIDDPQTLAWAYDRWIWPVDKVRMLVADATHPATFFCGGSRNSDRFITLFDAVFVLEIDLETLNQRLAARPKDAWGGTASEGESFARHQHATKAGLPQNAITIDATAPLASVVDTILANVVRT